jgi:hypothetical protein
MAYLTVDVPAARPILDLVSFGGAKGMSGAGFPSAILDRTETAVAAVYPPGSGCGFLLAAEGRFPAARAGLSFAFSPSWKKVSSPGGKRYWRSSREGLSVSLDSRSARVSDGDPYGAAGGVTPPDSFGHIRRGAALAGWIEDAAVPLNRFLENLGIPMRIPAERVVFGVYPLPAALPGIPDSDGNGGAGDSRYEAVLRIETQSSAQARGLIAMISLIRLFLDGWKDAGPDTPAAPVIALLANPPEQEDTALILRSAGMESGSIALLFGFFSVYSN